MNQYVLTKQGDFKEVIDFFKRDIASLRTGRANPAMLESVNVEAYGVKNSLNSLASITVSDARSMLVSPWDKGVVKSIEKAIVEAGLGVGVVNEGDKIRISIPVMTEENRKLLIKKLNEKQEAARVSVRRLRDEIKSSIEEAFSGKEIGEDDKFSFIKELDEEVRELNDEIKSIRDKKEEEIMTI